MDTAALPEGFAAIHVPTGRRNTEGRTRSGSMAQALWKGQHRPADDGYCVTETDRNILHHVTLSGASTESNLGRNRQRRSQNDRPMLPKRNAGKHQQLRNENKLQKQKGLIIVPTTLITNWIKELIET